MFRHAGVALLRASTDPGGLELPEALAAEGPDALTHHATWLAGVWERPEVRAALTVASPALAARIGALVSAREPDAGQVRRAVIALASYLLRWERRATPFGLFAGAGLARIGGPVRARWAGHRPLVRADAGWLGAIVARLHGCRELLDRLPVVASDTAVDRGGRLAAPGPPPDASPLDLAPAEVSVRRTAPVRAVLKAAAGPVPLGKLARQLAADFPGTSPERIGALASELLTQGVLVSGLRAPMTSTDPLGHVCGRLREAHAGEIPQISGEVRELAAINRGLRTARAACLLPDEALTARMKALNQAAETPSLVDTAVDCDVRVPDAVAREACAAAGVLHRATPCPDGYLAWVAYHQRFLDRYGPGVPVPLLDLTADSGLGYPAGYLGAAREPVPRPLTRRDATLLGLIQRAMAAGEDEIVLTEELIAGLNDGEREDISVPSRAEIAVEIRAASPEALDRGRFTLLVTGVPRPGSSMLGRHAHLLAEADRDLLAGTFGACEPGAVAAQLSFAPRKRRNENVARTCQLLPAIIPIGEHREPSGNLIPLGDLAVTADEDRFFLVRMPAGQRVEPRVTHALEAGTHTPPLARFLAEVTTARCAAYQAFDFGAAARLPYLPRIQYRKTILSPARWLLTARDLPGPGATAAEWDEALRAWRARWRVPDHVAIAEHDRRQPADLRHPVHRMILRSRLGRAGRLELREAAAPEDLGWLGRAHELVIPLVKTITTIRPMTPASRTGAGHLPGRSDILYARLSGHPGRFDEIITSHLPVLVTALGDRTDRWWFSRDQAGGRDADPYLGIYLVLASAASYGEAAAELAAWADCLRRCRLLASLRFDTYFPKTGCFGYGDVMDSAQDVFAADSAAALAQITLATRAGVDRRALTAASMTGLAAGFASCTDEGMSMLLDALPREHVRTDPGLRDQALRFASDHSDLASLPGGADVIAAWQQRGKALDGYRRRLAGSRDPARVLRALVESQTIRSAGMGSSDRQAARHLARACALRRLAAGAGR